STPAETAKWRGRPQTPTPPRAAGHREESAGSNSVICACVQIGVYTAAHQFGVAFCGLDEVFADAADDQRQWTLSRYLRQHCGDGTGAQINVAVAIGMAEG